MVKNKTMRFLEKIKKGEAVLGPFSKTSDPSMIEAMGYAGFDFIIIDLEHGPNTVLNAQNLIRAAEVSGTFPVIRVADNSATDIGKALDIGAKGVQVPQITTAEEALAAVSLILQLEGKEAIANFDDIIAVEGIDVIFLGPYDLSQALGVSGQINHPLVLEKMQYVIEKCKSKNIKSGVFTDKIQDAKGWINLGVDYISFSVDVGIIQEASKSIIHQLSI